MDYAEIGEEGTEGAARKLLVGKDHDTGHHFSHLVKCKGLGDERIVDKVIESIKETGNTNIRLKTDGEPALVQVQERIAEKRGQATIPENPPAYDPQSNGEAERAVQEVKAQLRATKLGLEARLGATIRVESPILEWMIPHAAHTINRYLVGKDGRTAYYRIHGRHFHGRVFEFGEQVLAKPKRKRKQLKQRTLDARMVEATWVGYSARSNEHIVVLAKGGPAIKVRTAKAVAEGRRWDSTAIEEIVATPDAPNPKGPQQQEPRGERHTWGLDFGAQGGERLPKQEIRGSSRNKDGYS